MRDLVAPAPKLCVQIVDIDKRTRRKEGMAQVLNLALDFPLLVAAPRRTRARRKVIVAGEFEQPRMKADRGAGTFEDGTAQIVVDQGAGDTLKRREGLDMAAQKTLERLIDGEERKDRRASTRAPSRIRRAGERRGRCGSSQTRPNRLVPLQPPAWSAADTRWPSPPGGSDARRAAAARPSRCSRGP